MHCMSNHRTMSPSKKTGLAMVKYNTLLPQYSCQKASKLVTNQSCKYFLPLLSSPPQQYQEKLQEDYESLEWYDNYWDYLEQKNSTNSSLGYQTRFTEVRTRHNRLLGNMTTLVRFSTAVSHLEHSSARVQRYTILTHC